jgi:hypothetical protein
VSRVAFIHQAFQNVPVFVALERRLTDANLLVREAGACFVIDSSRHIYRAAAMIRRYLRHITATHQGSLADLQNWLPWEPSGL